MIQPGTVAAIAASLMAQGEVLEDDADIFRFSGYRKARVQQFVDLALSITFETEKQLSELKGKP